LFGFIIGLACVGGIDQAVSTEAPAGNELYPEEARRVAVYRKACPAVVYITNLTRRPRDLFSQLFAPDQTEIPQGTGSGFVWDGEGHIVTNYHVILGATSLTVTLPDQSTWEARVVGVSRDKDMAVLKIDAPKDKLVPLELGSSSNLQVGQTVMAIGNPFGLDHSLTEGVVSALGRQIKSVTNLTIYDVIQTDATINPGNSGGPLLDSNGRLIGINTAIVSPSGASAGIGFAVPVDTVARMVPQLIKYQGVVQPGLGVTFISDRRARMAGFEEGVIIDKVRPGSTGDRAGLKGVNYLGRGYYGIGDVIIGVGKWQIRDQEDLLNALGKYDIGDEVSVHVLRGGKNRDEIKVRLQNAE
jgi:S1-C subfamily serine protease